MTEQKQHTSYESNPFKVIFKGFENFFKYNQAMAIVILVVGLFGAFFQSFQWIINSIAQSGLTVSSGINEVSSKGDLEYHSINSASSSTANSGDTGAAIAVVIIVLTLVVIFWITTFVIKTIYHGMVAYAAVQTANKKEITIGDAFHGAIKKFWTIVWIKIVVFFKILGGYLLLIVPGVRAQLRYNMVLLPVFSEDANAKTSISKSKNITKNHLMEILGMSFSSAIIPFVGGLMRAGGQSVIYPQLVHVSEGKLKATKTHWLNYLVFIVIGGIALLIVFITILVLALSSLN